MTLIRKHERVDGKFDVEPEDFRLIFAQSGPLWYFGLYFKDEGKLRTKHQESIPWDSVTAYIDPTEEVAPVEVKEDR